MPQKKKKPAPAHLARLNPIELLAKTGADGKLSAPDEFRIFKAGHNDSTKGVFKFTPKAADAVMAEHKKYGNDLSIDYAHAMFAFFTVDPAEAGKAAGWFKPEIRDGELWASQVQWTPAAEKKLLDREYRYISPAFDHSDDGEIKRLHNVALTNIPALHEIDPLMASSSLLLGPTEEETETEMTWKQLLAMLKLPETAGEAEAMAALSAREMPLVELLAVTGKATAGEALGVVKAWKVAAEETAKLHAELSTIKTAAAKAERQTLLDAGKREGKVPPALEPMLLSMDTEQLKAFLAAMPQVHKPAAQEVAGAGTMTVEVTKEDREVAAMMGLDVKDIAARRAAHGGRIPTGEMQTKPA